MSAGEASSGKLSGKLSRFTTRSLTLHAATLPVVIPRWRWQYSLGYPNSLHFAGLNMASDGV